MAKFSLKIKGKEVGQAAVYAEPHDMSGGSGVDLSNNGYGQRSDPKDLAVSVGALRSKPYEEPKTTGIKVRGTGCATKGLMARGPMA